MYPSPAVSDNTYHIHPDYATDYEPRKFQQQQHHQKPDTLNNAFRPNLNSYLSTARHRHQPNRSGFPPNQYRDTAPFYPASPPSEGFPPSMTSPVQPQMQSFEPRPNFDFGGPTSNGISGGPNPFLDGYNSTPMHQLHHLNGTKPQSAQQTPQTTYSIPYSNGPQISSQTPYGPHILAPTAAPPGTTATVSSIPPPGQPAAHSVASAHISSGQTNTEEISTIFVVGFPEDMQEREFQNMFTFSVDFEAATLKIPNKEYTAYGNVAGGVSGGPAGLRNGVTGYPTYAGPNDPYNLVTVNQGGVVVDTGREGTLTSWPAVPGEDASGGHFISGGTGTGMNIPRKQIIGFAKFKTREAALIARDGLQGRRVDIDKGAVLKAEMAKKNLHTKRGVGPVSGGTAGPTNGAGSGSVSTAGGIHPTFPNSAPTNALPYSTSNNDSLGAREREIGTLGAMGLGGRLNQWRDQIHQQQQQQDYPQANGPNGVSLGERAEDDRRANLMNAMGLTSLGSITRGPRERAEDDERERRRKEKDAMRLRAGNTSAYEAFHSVPAGISRHTPSGAGLLSEGDAGSIGLFVNNGGTAGPWDDAKTRLTRPRSPSRSASPSKGNSPFSDFPSQTFSPSVEVPNFQFFAHVRNDQPALEQFSTEPGATRGHQSHASGVASGGDVPNTDTELVRALDGLDMNSEAGKTSPELPSPASGASSRNGIDQNPPINTLYVGNLPTSSSVHGLPQDHLEANLRELFQNQSGYRRLCFRQKPNGPMCFVEFEDVPHATKALNDLYGNNLKGLVKGGIRLSYSKNPLGVRTPTSSGSNGPTLQQQQLQNSNNNFLNSYPVPFPPDLQPRFSDEPQSRTMPLTGRRDMSVSTSPMPASQPFMADFTAASSPPPRFFSTSPSGFPPSTSSAPLTGSANAFIPRYGYNNLPASSGTQPSSTFSPFGLSSTPPPHPTIPDLQTTSGDHLSLHTQHTVQNNFAPANNLEAARAGREGSI